MGETGAGSADVVALTPDHPQAQAMRDKFLSEHVHTEDEVRFVVRDAGHFVMQVGGTVWDARCEQGDLISVPANTRHWFDAGERPDFCAARLLQSIRLGGAVHRDRHGAALPRCRLRPCRRGWC
jgi:1,2-dihydroxy-3-keto-5-methylthiopentene dioxygenase